jgi:predicted NBD/HSP70 family sugar kinase
VSARQAVGIDIGGTKIAALRISAAGEIRSRCVIPTPATDPSAAMPAIEAAAAAVF